MDVIGSATLTDCTVSANSASLAGGVFINAGTATLTDCTVSANSASLAGGGIANGGIIGALSFGPGTATLTDCTVSGNSASKGGGLYNYSGAATLANTIVSGNAAATGPDVDGAAVTSQGHNLVGIADGSSGWDGGTDLTGTAAVPLDAKLAPLGDYGGPTQTMALLPGSAAIAAGLGQSNLTTDQRGPPRATSGPVDIGAVQVSLVVESGAGTVDTSLPALTLPGAVSLADTYADSLITFAFQGNTTTTLAATLHLSNTTGTTTIDGPAGGVTVSGGKAVGVFSVANSVTASISGLTISGGSATNGGGVYNRGTLTLTGCTVSGNSAGKYGGGVSDYSILMLTNCTVSGNSSGSFGGGILSSGGTLTLTDCTLSGNSSGNGGGLFNLGTATLTDCTLSGNSSKFQGGGLGNLGGAATLTDCTLSANSAGTDGGGLDNAVTATLTGCTISGNSASVGGGLYNYTGTVFHGTAALTDTIVAGNTASSAPSDIVGSGASAVTGTNNLIGTGGSGGISGGTGGNIVLTDLSNLGLAPLGNYGGPTQTMALLPGSAAIGAGLGRAASPPTSAARRARLPAPSTSAPSRSRATPWPSSREARKAR